MYQQNFPVIEFNAEANLYISDWLGVKQINGFLYLSRQIDPCHLAWSVSMGLFICCRNLSWQCFVKQ
jgi:hypothetical protein